MKCLSVLGKGIRSLFLPELCRCALCGEERELVEQTGFCQRCWAELPHREEPMMVKESLVVIAPFSYAGAVEEMVKGLKFHNERYLAEALGCVMAQACLQRSLEADALVPVPLGKDRQHERGYNQAALLAEGMAAWMDIPVEPGWLRRIRSTEQQAMLGALQRRANVYGAFEAQEAVKGKRICLVDDVVTTGCTVRACADALEAKGASIWVCAVYQA